MVPWMEGYYALPSEFNLQKSKLFQSARIYGQDVSSGAAVAALLSSKYDCVSVPNKAEKYVEGTQDYLRILDLCCCPGLKLCAIADTLYHEGKRGEIFGVDVSESRMALCKRILHKYQIQPSLHKNTLSNGTCRNVRIRLFCNDGTNFATAESDKLNLVFDSMVSQEDEISRMGKRKRMNKSARAREAKRLKGIVADPEKNGMELFDRVLVDAECSTDGSVIHIQKRLLRGQNSIRPGQCVPSPYQKQSLEPVSVFDDNQLYTLYALQRQLASSGYQLLRKGGFMVYSTCSLSQQQNCDVVQWILNAYSDARIVPLNFSTVVQSTGEVGHNAFVQEANIPGTIQFFPNIGTNPVPVDLQRLYGGGFYVAKIKKL
jgi:16S rRNA C967 or C1407 C5-methylase (RsmB/RsmF family)